MVGLLIRSKFEVLRIRFDLIQAVSVPLYHCICTFVVFISPDFGVISVAFCYLDDCSRWI